MNPSDKPTTREERERWSEALSDESFITMNMSIFRRLIADVERAHEALRKARLAMKAHMAYGAKMGECLAGDDVMLEAIEDARAIVEEHHG